MKTAVLKYAAALPALSLMLSVAVINPAYAQAQQPGPQGVEPEFRGSTPEGSSANLKLLPSQERIPRPDEQPRIDPSLIIPPIENPPSSPAVPAASPVNGNPPSFRAPLVNGLERGKWYVQIGVYTRADYVENAIGLIETSAPVVIHNAGTDTNPMFRVLLGPFSQNESKTVQRRFKNKGYDAFLRKG